MNITVLGSGNVAYFMAMRLHEAGHSIVEIYGRKPKPAGDLADLVHAKPVHNLDDLSDEAAVFIFALPDSVLSEFAQLFPFKDKIAIHCAGALSVDILNFENAGVIWPLYSIKKGNLPSKKNIPLFWEAKGETVIDTVCHLALDISDNVRQANLSQRKALHLSAVFVNNFVNHLMAITQLRMQEEGFNFEQCFQPIIEQTIHLALKGKSAENQTGPAIRKDNATMESHLELLAAHPDWQAIYKAISTSIQQFYYNPKST